MGLFRHLILLVAASGLLVAFDAPASARTASCNDAYLFAVGATGATSTTVTLLGSAKIQNCTAVLSYMLSGGPDGEIERGQQTFRGSFAGHYDVVASGLTPGATYTFVGQAVSELGTIRLPRGPRLPTVTMLSRLDVVVRGGGTVASLPAGISCGSTCGVDVPNGGGFTLTATPAPGWQFSHWEGDACYLSTSPTCPAWVTGGVLVFAVFEQATLVTVERVGTGAGRVGGGALDCGGVCSATIPPAQPLSLVAAPEPGSRFDGWGGGCTGTAPTCTVTPAPGAVTVQARFVKLATLTVVRTGGGSVAGGAIECGTKCSAIVDDGAEVALRAVPRRGYRFVRWAGACAGSSPLCTVKLEGDTSVAATFKAKPKPKPKKKRR